jgi:hypothetical protein
MSTTFKIQPAQVFCPECGIALEFDRSANNQYFCNTEGCDWLGQLLPIPAEMEVKIDVVKKAKKEK